MGRKSDRCSQKNLRCFTRQRNPDSSLSTCQCNINFNTNFVNASTTYIPSVSCPNTCDGQVQITGNICQFGNTDADGNWFNIFFNPNGGFGVDSYTVNLNSIGSILISPDPIICNAAGIGEINIVGNATSKWTYRSPNNTSFTMNTSTSSGIINGLGMEFSLQDPHNTWIVSLTISSKIPIGTISIANP